MIEQFLFFLFAVVAVVAALGMLVARSPVHSVLWLVLNLFSVASLYLLLNATFLAVIQILIYAGAIMVLFLFVIMLLNLDELPRVNQLRWGPIVGFFVGTLVLAQLVYVVAIGLDVVPESLSVGTAAELGSVTEVGRVLFTEYAFPLEIIALLLLAATVGAVLLAKKRFE